MLPIISAPLAWEYYAEDLEQHCYAACHKLACFGPCALVMNCAPAEMPACMSQSKFAIACCKRGLFELSCQHTEEITSAVCSCITEPPM